ncbi:hypothetical protein [Phaeocystidibacter luteus]|uniref:TPM domain-containing protein n=1 Tax=Phaeocystidibacter luteus TaxID=911197 RepID=A0A6N6REL8_9FLAO|nr:hypothetical protein [Phaeocystidibacter luteus]KAB2808616.1 hypothetical protein F8C67_10030 [Phaeocystidibacter luteus]
MKKVLIALAAFAAFACSNESSDANVETIHSGETPELQESIEISLLEAFAENPAVLKSMEGNQIETLIEDAKANADQVLTFYVANAEKALEVAAGYQYAVVVTGNHTAVRIASYDDCQQSGSWGICMPLVEGFIRKGGELKEEADYMNMVVGRPDDQNRKIYLLNRVR